MAIINFSAAPRSATLVVAASDATAAEKAGADYVCDGTADDVQINAAIQALPATGGSVVLSSGTFNIAATVALDSYTTLCGQGRSTILKAATNLNADVIGLTSTAQHRLALRSFNVDGNKANQSTSGTGINITNGDTSGYPHDTDVHNRFSDLFIYDCKDDGFKLISTTSMAALLHMIEVYKCDGNGFQIGSPDNMLLQCTAGNNGLRGFTLVSNSGNCQLSSCKAFGSGQITAASGQGFKVISTRVLFSNCQSQDNKDAGYEVGWTDEYFVGCTADSNGVVGTPRPGFDVKVGGDRSRFIGCIALDRNAGAARKQSYGLEIASGALNVNWVGGGFYNNLTGPVNSAEATAKIVAAEGYAPVFATGAGHTVDELITYLQGLGLAAQS